MKAVKTLFAVLALATFAGAANAQSDGSTMAVQKPFSVKLGGIFFNDGDTKDAIGNNTLSIGLGYDFLKTQSANPILFQVYGDYFTGKSRTEAGIESSLEYAFGVGASARYQFIQDAAAEWMPYGGLGLGLYSLKAKAEGRSGNVPVDVSESKTGVGGKVFLGIESKQGFLGEIEFNFLPEIEVGNGAARQDFSVSGFGARIGYRF